MPLYERPNQYMSRDVSRRWIRLGEDVFIWDNLAEDNHDKLAQKDGLTKQIDKLRRTNPTQVDAGYYGTDPNNPTEPITVSRDSSSLNLPVEGYEIAAREITIVEFL